MGLVRIFGLPSRGSNEKSMTYATHASPEGKKWNAGSSVRYRGKSP